MLEIYDCRDLVTRLDRLRKKVYEINLSNIYNALLSDANLRQLQYAFGAENHCVLSQTRALPRL